MKIAFITGVTGQDGSYLAKFLLQKGYKVIGLVRRTSLLKRDRIDKLIKHPKKKNFILEYGDMCDGTSLHQIISKYKPNEIYNLAAQSHVKISFEIPEYTSETITTGTLKLLEAVRLNNLTKKSRIYQASTSEMYGNEIIKSANEKTSFKPVSPYGVAKLYAHNLCNVYKDSYGMFICCGVLFNHESPERGDNFVSQKIISSAIKIKYGSKDVLKLGNIYAKRDWGYAPDYIEAMWKMINLSEPKNLIISTNQSITVKKFTEIVFKKLNLEIKWVGSGLKEKAVLKSNKERCVVKIDKNYFRPKDINFLKGDSSLAQKLIGWKPDKTPLNQLIDIMLQAELNKQK